MYKWLPRSDKPGDHTGAPGAAPGALANGAKSNLRAGHCLGRSPVLGPQRAPALEMAATRDCRWQIRDLVFFQGTQC